MMGTETVKMMELMKQNAVNTFDIDFSSNSPNEPLLHFNVCVPSVKRCVPPVKGCGPSLKSILATLERLCTSY